MPIEMEIWRVGKKLERVQHTPLDSETKLEDWILQDISVLSMKLLPIGRQIRTAFKKEIDILAMDAEGNLVVIELKKGRTPREVVAQVLDYASWVADLTRDDIEKVFADYNEGNSLDAAFAETFGGGLAKATEGALPDELNENHRLIIVASELDGETERIIQYLATRHGVPINAVFFRHYKDRGGEYLTRTWLVDPHTVEAKAGRTIVGKTGETWNGRDFYVNVGEDEDESYRTWEDCRKYGFVAAGHGAWYSNSLSQLFPGARVFVMIPKTGYVGVGIVKDEVVPVKKFMVEEKGKAVPILKMPLTANKMRADVNDPELCEYLVRVEWIKTVPKEEAYWEKGLFANQNTVCKLRRQFTIDRVKARFKIKD